MIPPAPTRWCEDHAGLTAPDTCARIDAKLEAYQHETGHQVVVWIGDTTGDDELADWANRTFAAWHVGRAKEDDGLAVFVLANDHTIAIEVGYGLEGQVPDLVAKRIIDEVMAPRLRAGDADDAITTGVDTVIKAIEGRDWSASRVAQEPQAGTSDLILGAVMLLAFLFLAIRRPGLAAYLVGSMMFGRRGGGGGGGGGFSGGGGSSGGGGARGSW